MFKARKEWMTVQDLIRLEQQSWQALSSTNKEAKQFYTSLLTDDALMLFPGGMRLEGKVSILDSIGAQPWQTFELEAPRVLSLSKDVGVVVYKVTAQREGHDPYAALISSTYIFLEGQWKLALHQQTPV